MTNEKEPLNFIEQIIESDLNNGLSQQQLRFRFPPEPNGFLHIGHAKAICLNFGLGEKYNAPVNLRFDDTNPAKEEQAYVDAIKEDIKWLGFQWDQEKYSSDQFEQLYQWAITLIKEGKAYVDDQSSDEIASQKGTPTEAGTESPNRKRSVEENLSLFEKMKNGELAEGSHVLRAKIDMASPNMHMRDPIMYRIIRKAHHRTGDKWNIYPMYDWAHGECDYLENISHSLCTLEFEVHRELYEWYLSQVFDSETIRPKQREFARLNLSYTVMSKRKLLQLVEENHVSGWDDPRMPTISGLRRRGYTPAAIKQFSDTIGIAKRNNVIDVSLLEHCIKSDLNKTASRIMAVLNPLKLVLENLDEGETIWLDAENNPEDSNAGTRKVPFSKTLYIEQEDFKEEANKKFFRLKLGGEVRLKNAFIIKAERVDKDENGKVTCVYASVDKDSRSGSGTEASQRKVKGTLHWVSAAHAVDAEVRLYDRLFNHEAPDADKNVDFKTHINPNSLKIQKAIIEPSVKNAKVGHAFQFQRHGYFNVDKDSTESAIVFNKTVGLTDSWAKANQKQTEKKNTRSVVFEKLRNLAGKLIKARTEEDKAGIYNEMNTEAKALSLNDLTPYFDAKSNKEVLSMVLALNFVKPEVIDEQINQFVLSALKSQNSLIKHKLIELLGENESFRKTFIDEIKAWKETETNPFILSLLDKYLN